MATQAEVKDDPQYRVCLDHGFVGLVDVMGDDSSIIQAARVSYGKGTKKVSEDRGLIRYLRRHLHTTPYEMVEFKFHCKMPIFVARQWIRHRTANVNEYSGRYSEMPNEFYIPLPEDVAPQSSSNHQGRSGYMNALDAARFIELVEKQCEGVYGLYKAFLNENGEAKSYGFSDEFPGVAKEIARMVLPLNNYTEWYWKCDLHNIMHFLALRLDSHAQKEIQVFGQAMYELIQPIVPEACQAFEDYRLYGETLSRMEVSAIQTLLADSANQTLVLNELSKDVKGRELQEFKDKFGLE